MYSKREKMYSNFKLFLLIMFNYRYVHLSLRSTVMRSTIMCSSAIEPKEYDPNNQAYAFDT